MNCPRCNGLAVSDYSIDQQTGRSSGFHASRCVNCGMIGDDVIHENQLTALARRKRNAGVSHGLVTVSRCCRSAIV
jgi:hypothetical protein